MQENQLGLIHIYHGEGKGKTTSAVGLCVRALGRGRKVLFVQFLKAWDSGELHILGQLENVQIMRGKPCGKFTFQMNEAEKAECLQAHKLLWAEVLAYLQAHKVDLLILDELLGTYHHGLLNKIDLLQFLQNKPQELEIVMTGRNPAPELLAIADYISEIKKVRHPFDKGIGARIGIEK